MNICQKASSLGRTLCQCQPSINFIRYLKLTVAVQHYYYHGHSGSAISWLQFSFEKKSRPNSASIGDTAGAVDEDHHYRRHVW